MKTVSLQNQLIKTSLISSVMVGSLALLIFVVVSVYQTMHVQDEIMDEISDMLLLSDLTTSSGKQIDELSEQFDIQYRLKNSQLVLTQSEGFPLDQEPHIFPNDHHQYGFFWQNHQLWRSYVAKDHQANMNVLVIQPLEERFEELLHSFAAYFLILLMVWSLQWMILYFLIKRQFKVVHQLSKQISAKNAEDLSPIKFAEFEVKELQPILAQLNYLLKRLDNSLKAEQRFTADASHELRSPLSAIQLRLQLLQRKYPERAKELDSIQLDVSRGIQTLENLLLLARLDPEHPEHLPKTYFDLNEMVKLLLSDFSTAIETKNLEIVYQNILSDKKLDIFANEQLIYTCLRNILDNAIRYSEVNHLIHIKLDDDSDYINLTIENQGAGLDTEVLERLGERFFRVLGTKTQGSGLGLSICKKIIELHRGRITFAQSSIGGLKVQIQLPKTI